MVLPAERILRLNCTTTWMCSLFKFRSAFSLLTLKINLVLKYYSNIAQRNYFLTSAFYGLFVRTEIVPRQQLSVILHIKWVIYFELFLSHFIFWSLFIFPTSITIWVIKIFLLDSLLMYVEAYLYILSPSFF